MIAGAALGILAGLVHLTSYGLYCRKILRGEVLPNTATWILWACLSALNASSYIMMSRDPLKGMVAVAGAASCTIILFLSIAKGKLSSLSGYDVATLIVGLGAGLVWLIFRSATSANLILQAGFLFSMIPSYRRVLRDATSEPVLPWFLWSLAYAVSISVVFIRWSGNYPDLAYPVLCMLTHGGVGTIAVLNRKNNR